MKKESGLYEINGGKNMYSDVKDFKWLKKQQSPHWRLIDIESGQDNAVDRSECAGIVSINTREATAATAAAAAAKEATAAAAAQQRRSVAERSSCVGDKDEDDKPSDSEDEL